mmetsp:Transcript_2044/g.6624  ORF Transcript_2044/g.6624 Transcript_2044/m.6624 type:complete len:202 (+) Transcript_2044:546-1151(+)
MNLHSDGDGPQRQGISWPDGSALARGQHLPRDDVLRCKHIRVGLADRGALGHRCVMQQRNPCRPVRIVLQALHDALKLLPPREINLSVHALMPPTPMPRRYPAVVVPPAALREPLGQRFERPPLPQVLAGCDDAAPQAWRHRLILLQPSIACGRIAREKRTDQRALLNARAATGSCLPEMWCRAAQRASHRRGRDGHVAGI